MEYQVNIIETETRKNMDSDLTTENRTFLNVSFVIKSNLV